MKREEKVMRKIKVLVALALTLSLVSTLAACGERVNEQQNPVAAPEILEDTINPEDETVIEIPIDDEFEFPEQLPEQFPEDPTPGFAEVETQTFEEMLEGLTENEYPELVVTAAVLERMAILPGSTFRVNVVIENQGEETVRFVRGSGSNVVPDALIISAEGLQPIFPIDNMGIATMDFQIDFLEPGETLNFDLYVRAIEPNENMFNYAFELLQNDEGFIGDMDWETLSQRFPDLEAVAPGSYTISVYFLYAVAPNYSTDASNYSIDANLECDLEGVGMTGIFDVVETGFNVSTIEVYISE